jgi:hypothetical protein
MMLMFYTLLFGNSMMRGRINLLCLIIIPGVSVSASVFTITAMSLDRYIAIRHPMSRKIITRRTTTKVSHIPNN